MPCLKILTNLPKSNVPSEFVHNILPILSKVTNKPQEKCVCVVSCDCHLSFGGKTNKPGAVATLESIGNLGLMENQLIAKEISAYVENVLGISQDRFFFSFYDMKPQNVAIEGTTVAAKMGQ